ncbi:MAG: hypothetical protein WA231_01030 [Methylocella sp.]
MVTYWLDEILLATMALVLWGAHDFDAIARPSRECDVAKAVLGLLNWGYESADLPQGFPLIEAGRCFGASVASRQDVGRGEVGWSVGAVLQT